MKNTIICFTVPLAAMIFVVAIACGTNEQTPASTDSPISTPTPDSEIDSDSLTSDTLTIEEVVSRGESPFVNGPKQIRPGQSYEYTIAIEECCVFVAEVDAQVKWSAIPATGPVIDPVTGLFTVDAETPNGTTFTITADVENGQFAPVADVQVFTPEANPLIGFWREEEPGTINELIFRTDGSFTVTWTPFETYKDYWGTYEFELDTGIISLTIAGGNRMPVGFEGSGSFSFDGEDMVIMKDVCLGSYLAASQELVPNYDHHFSR